MNAIVFLVFLASSSSSSFATLLKSPARTKLINSNKEVVLDRTRRDPNDLNDYEFSLPDIFVEYKKNDGITIVLEGFKIKTNDQILREGKSDMFKRLHWLSLGHPTLVAMLQHSKPNQKQQLFH